MPSSTFIAGIVTFAFWATVTVAGLLVSRDLHRKSKRFAARLCVACGYDMRASGDACPECGASRERGELGVPRDISPHNKVKLGAIRLAGYRTGIAEHNGQWISTAKRDSDGEFYSAKAEGEDEVVAALAELVGVDAMDG